MGGMDGKILKSVLSDNTNWLLRNVVIIISIIIIIIILKRIKLIL